jgi:hypothetical protein
MGLMNIFNIATKATLEDIGKDLAPLLAPGEEVCEAYKLIRDYFVFTNWRLLMVDKQGITGKKVEYHSVPYRSITHFSVETAGTLDIEGELKVWVSGRTEPFEKKFSAATNILEVQQAIAAHIAK